MDLASWSSVVSFLQKLTASCQLTFSTGERGLPLNLLGLPPITLEYSPCVTSNRPAQKPLVSHTNSIPMTFVRFSRLKAELRTFGVVVSGGSRAWVGRAGAAADTAASCTGALAGGFSTTAGGGVTGGGGSTGAAVTRIGCDATMGLGSGAGGGVGRVVTSAATGGGGGGCWGGGSVAMVATALADGSAGTLRPTA